MALVALADLLARKVPKDLLARCLDMVPGEGQANQERWANLGSMGEQVLRDLVGLVASWVRQEARVSEDIQEPLESKDEEVPKALLAPEVSQELLAGMGNADCEALQVQRVRLEWLATMGLLGLRVQLERTETQDQLGLQVRKTARQVSVTRKNWYVVAQGQPRNVTHTRCQ